MMMIEWAFWIVVLLLFYTYLGYVGILWLLARLGGRSPQVERKEFPAVSLIITAYNEEDSIRGKLENALGQDYPAEKLQVLVASDGSTDGTERVVKEFQQRGVELVAGPRVGKESAKARVLGRIRGDILVFSDATSLWSGSALRSLVEKFSDPRVGCVSGRTSFQSQQKSSVTEGLVRYWDFEVLTKSLESRLGHLVVVCGTIHAVRRELYGPLPSEGSADMMVPLRVLERGYRSVYEPAAVAVEKSRSDPSQEIQSRIRMSTRAFWLLRLEARFLNPFYRPRITFFLVSHKALRWTAPVFLVALLVLNLFLLGNPVYRALMVMQLLFYGAALVGHAAARSGKKLFSGVYYFCLINSCALIGLGKFLKGEKVATWETLR